jgi:hypothetical protein
VLHNRLSSSPVDTLVVEPVETHLSGVLGMMRLRKFL